ncbi:MAG: CBS domain-containing protein [Desulfuromonadales bacterium]|nr:CBS domain-containing protein [Desulfuromonadales bacterium]
MLKVKDVMTKDVISVTKTTKLTELAKIFTDKKISGVPVLDDNGKLIGMVTETDLVDQDKNLHIPTVVAIFDWVIYLESDKKFEQELNKMTGQTVADIYSDNPVTVTPETPVADVADIFSKRRFSAVPVVDGGSLVGIVSRIDLVRSMAG